MEGFQNEVKPFWVSEVNTKSSGAVDVMEKAVDYLRRLVPNAKRIGIETAFIPLDSAAVLRKAFPNAETVDALFVLERLRARKTPHELEMLKIASDAVIDSMEAVFKNFGPGATKNELTEALRREETQRGLTFDYCLIAAGSSFNRAPSDQRWEKGDVLSIDSGGNYHGYIGDVARMGVAGEPDAELVDLLAEVEAIEQAAMKPIRAGRFGQRNLRGRRHGAAHIKAAQPHPFPRARHGARQPRSAAADQFRPGALRRL